MPFDINKDRWGEGSTYPFTTHMVNFRPSDGRDELTVFFADIEAGERLDREDAIGYLLYLERHQIWTEPGYLVVYELNFYASNSFTRDDIFMTRVEVIPPLILPLNFPLRIGKY